MDENAEQGNKRLALVTKDGVVRTGLSPVLLRAIRRIPAVGKFRRHIGDIAGDGGAITAAEITLPVEQLFRSGSVKYEFESAEPLRRNALAAQAFGTGDAFIFFGEITLHLFQAQTLLVGVIKHAFETVLLDDRADTHDLDGRPARDSIGKSRLRCRLRRLGRSGAKRFHTAFQRLRRLPEVVIAGTDETVHSLFHDTPHLHGVKRRWRHQFHVLCLCRLIGQKQQHGKEAGDFSHGIVHQRDSRKASKACRSDFCKAAKASRAFCASPPCHNIASGRLRARPSCR
ncbi:hypothetical protein D3C86_1312340 [compost metagenome]